MASPIKPWEARANENSRSDAAFNAKPSVRFRLPSGTSKSNDNQRNTDSPPTIPSRQRNTYSQGYGSSIATPSYGIYGGGGYTPYGSHGGYGVGSSYYPSYGLNRSIGYDTSGMHHNNFIRRAEDSCRPAFDSVQSIVQAFASIATMLDSTFFAVHSSFRAVLGVADQFGNLKMHITNTLGAFAVFRGIKYIFRRIMAMLRIYRGDLDVVENDSWADAASDVASEKPKKMPKSWPIVLFFAVVLGTPWLIWKLLQTMNSDESTESWMTGSSEHFEAQADYDFDAENEDELSLQAGDLLKIAPQTQQPNVRGWLLATVDGRTSGLVPANYVKILGRRRRTRKRTPREITNEETEEKTDRNSINKIYEEVSKEQEYSDNTDQS